MKNTIRILLTLQLFTLCVRAQDMVTIDAKKMDKAKVPTNIKEAVVRDFPDRDIVDYYILPSERVNKEWAVTVEDNLKAGEQVDHYTVLLRGKKGGYIYGLYNKKGQLKSLKILALDFGLPSSISTAATTGPYEGYQIKSDKYIKIINNKSKKEYVEVVVTKGEDTKKLYFTPTGELIKAK